MLDVFPDVSGGLKNRITKLDSSFSRCSVFQVVAPGYCQTTVKADALTSPRVVLWRTLALSPALIQREPAGGLERYLWRDRMTAIELPVRHLVTGALEPGDDPAAAPLDREHAVAPAVGDEEPRGAYAHRRRHEAGRESQNVGEEVAIVDS